jgi:DNA invertase Pin-like site-specific DNA recombinase
MRIGYARSDEDDASLALQIEALKNAGCDVIHYDIGGGDALTDRDTARNIIIGIKEGDVVVVTKIDRLSRDTRELQNIAEMIAISDAKLEAIEQPFDLSTSSGKMMFDMLSVFAEFERNSILERSGELW